MPVCEICDSETFESRDGLYYCMSCGTQSQDFRDEACEETVADQYRHLSISKKKKHGREAFHRTKGKPWIMEEAFQIIIKAQVNFLVGLGVDPQLKVHFNKATKVTRVSTQGRQDAHQWVKSYTLEYSLDGSMFTPYSVRGSVKDVVHQMWCKYLQMLGIAFCEMGEFPPSLQKSYAYQHNAKAMGKEVKRKKNREEYSDDEYMYLELSSQIAGEEFYSDDDPDPDHDKSSSGDEWEGEESAAKSIHADDESIGSCVLGKQKKFPYCRRMVLRTTLSFSYLGLLWLDEPVFLSDIFRWVKEGHFPYLQAASLLPDYMKFSEKDTHAFSAMAVPLRLEVLRDASFIASLIQLPALPERDLTVYTARYIMDLNLPPIMHRIVRKLLKIFKPDIIISQANQLKRSLRFEETAMAYVMLAMKMSYGLDDSENETQAKLATTIESIESSHDSLPVWKDWAACFRECQTKRQACGIPWSDEELQRTCDPRSYGVFCKTNIFGSWSIRDLELTEERASVLGPQMKFVRKEYRDSCAEVCN